MGLSRPTDFYGKKAHVIGIARSGLAAAEVLRSLGATVTMHDHKESPQLEDALNKVLKMGLEAKTGKHAYEDIETADLVIPSPGVPPACPGLVTARDHGIPIMSEVELGYRISPAPIIAVTGTNGKTTITYLLESIFKAAGLSAGVLGTVNYRWGGKVLPAPNTTPESLEFQQILDAMGKAGVSHVIAEVSSHALDLGRVEEVMCRHCYRGEYQRQGSKS